MRQGCVEAYLVIKGGRGEQGGPKGAELLHLRQQTRGLVDAAQGVKQTEKRLHSVKHRQKRLHADWCQLAPSQGLKTGLLVHGRSPVRLYRIRHSLKHHPVHCFLIPKISINRTCTRGWRRSRWRSCRRSRTGSCRPGTARSYCTTPGKGQIDGRVSKPPHGTQTQSPTRLDAHASIPQDTSPTHLDTHASVPKKAKGPTCGTAPRSPLFLSSFHTMCAYLGRTRLAEVLYTSMFWMGLSTPPAMAFREKASRLWSR